MTDYRPTESRLYIHRLKGSRSAEFLLTAVEQSALRAWLRVRGSAPGPLFLSRNVGRSRAGDWTSSSSITVRLPTHVLAILGNLAAVQDHLGHADIRSTQIYAQFTNDFGQKSQLEPAATPTGEISETERDMFCANMSLYYANSAGRS